jgi:alpha-tubulin suppressor-like RCC1 family protein
MRNPIAPIREWASDNRRATISRLLALTVLAGGCRDAEPPTAPAELPVAAAKFAVTGLKLVTVSAGSTHSCGLSKLGQALCWGSNLSGNLGDGTNNPTTEPVLVVGGYRFSSISAGASFHTCGVAEAGQALCWGDNGEGQLGNGTNTPASEPVGVTGGFQFASISAGSFYTCGVTSAGQALCWGNNNLGTLGNGTDGPGTEVNEPTPVAGGFEFASVTAGAFHACGVTKGGQALCWGANEAGQLGDGTNALSNEPVAVAAAFQFSSISAGNRHTCGVAKGGQALCWGDNGEGQLGNGTSGAGTETNAPGGVAPTLQFTSITAGDFHTCGTIKGGATLCWGFNGNGTLGNGTTTGSDVPVEVAGGFEFMRLDAGRFHSCGITKQLGTWCWGGNNGFGTLGNGTTVDAYAPSPVSDPL